MSNINKIRNTPSLLSTRILIAGFYLLTIVTHVLIIGTVIPYGWVNGGMSSSFEAQATQSVVSIVITSALFLFVWKVVNGKGAKVWQRRALYVLTALWMIGFIMQLLGTPFERYAMSIVLLVGIIGHVRLIRELSGRGVSSVIASS